MSQIQANSATDSFGLDNRAEETTGNADLLKCIIGLGIFFLLINKFSLMFSLANFREHF
jgi:hypothetical protein